MKTTLLLLTAIYLCACDREPVPVTEKIPHNPYYEHDWVAPTIPVPGEQPEKTNAIPPPANGQLHTWQIVYYGTFEDNGADLTILDLFEHSAADVARCRYPIAYFSAHYEKWRPDAGDFGRKGRSIPGWKNENYVDWTDPKVQSVMKNRLRLAVDKGFRGVDIDNVDGPGGRDYFPWLYTEAKRRGLTVGLKNFVEILPAWGEQADFFVSEASAANELSCYQRFKKPVVRMYYGKGAKTPDYIYPVRSKNDGNRF